MSAYLLVKWLRHPQRPRFLLFWALSLFLMYWFEVPLILGVLGKVVTVTSFNLFFAMMLPVTFLALVLLYRGTLELLEIRWTKKANTLFFFWFLAAVVFFGYVFTIGGGIIRTYALTLGGTLMFFVPIRALIILTLTKWLWRARDKTISGILGASAIIAESVFGIISNLLIVRNIMVYPPEFWYLALISLKIFFMLRMVNVVLIAFGYFFFCKNYHRPRAGRA